MYIGALNVKQNSTSLVSACVQYPNIQNSTTGLLPLGEPALLPHVSACFVARLKG